MSADECVVVFKVSGVEVVAREGEMLLEVAERSKVDIPSLCRGGTCTTCRVRLLEGAPKIDTVYGLTKRQRAQGYILTCSARATPGRIVLEA